VGLASQPYPFVERLRKQLPNYARLMRLDRPIGTYLLLWPALWALWLAGDGAPQWQLLIIFSIGTLLMRSAGCVINDFADRNFDPLVQRTRERPMAVGAVSEKEALALFVLVCLAAFGLVLLTNPLTVYLSFIAVALAAMYPFMKRYTQLPQLVLGAAYSWSIPMAFSAQSNELPAALWLLYFANLVWTVAYDTFYAMVDRDDDLKIGVKSTAILFGDADRAITACLQIVVILLLILTGRQFGLGLYFYLGLAAAAGMFVHQQYLIRHRQREQCFQAFLNNNRVGAAIFVGLVLDYLPA
jgi:4-hydroxybenzoate polyprenyltransferase